MARPRGRSGLGRGRPSRRFDPVRLEVFRHLLFAIAEEMGVSLCRSSYSPNIKERRDFSCALFDGEGRLAAQAAHIPAHLGAMPLSVRAVMEHLALGPGDAAILNDPFRGGNHLPDITLVSGVFPPGAPSGRPSFYVANRAHHADVGGTAPGSMSVTTEIFQDGILIPPLKLVKGGVLDRDILSLILANVRTPREREGDLTAQLAANRTGERRLLEVVARYGLRETLFYTRALQAHAEAMTRAAIRAMPEGVYEFADAMDDDGVGEDPVPIRVRVTIRGDSLTVDYTGSAPQTRGSVNAVESIALTAVNYVVRTLVEYDIPANAGVMDPVRVVAPPGTVVNSRFPAAVAGGNVETSQRMVDAILGAFAQALPGRVPAASCGSMNNLSLGGIDPRTGEPYTYYETVGGGMGASPRGEGESAIHTHLTNTMNTPVEALEHAFPLRVRQYSIRRGSGGRGKFRGGDGIVREIEFRGDATLSLMSERRRFPPWGLCGGEPGRPGENLLVRGGRRIPLPGKVRVEVRKGDVFRMSTPGGGGWGRLASRRGRARK